MQLRNVFCIPADLSLSEVMASIQILQATGGGAMVDHPEHRVLLQKANLRTEYRECTSKLAYAEAYRQIDSSPLSYVDVLASQSGFKALQTLPPVFPSVRVSESVVVACTGGIRSDITLNDAVWREIIKLLRFYGLPMRVVGARIGGCALKEEEFTYTVEERLEAVASASLVVGTPNEWMWAAAGMDKRIAVLYPERVPPRRWFHFESEQMGRVVYDLNTLQLPVMIAGLRMLIDRL